MKQMGGARASVSGLSQDPIQQEMLACSVEPEPPQMWKGRVTRSSNHITRRLSLEATFIQKDENELAGLLERLDVRLADRRPGKPRDRLEGIFGLAVDINALRLRQGDRMDRLTHFFRKWMVPAKPTPGVRPSEEAPLHLNKSLLLRAAADTWEARVGAKPKFMRLSLKGHSISIDRLCAALACYRGPLLNLMDTKGCPRELKPLSEYLGLLGSTSASVHCQLQSLGSLEEVAALQAKLATMQAEFSSLVCLSYACNARFHGVRESWQVPVHLEGVVRKTMAELGLRSEQVQSLRDIRAQTREKLTALTVGANCSSDLLEDTLCTHADKMTILELVEAIESCRLDVAALYVQCATEMLVDVLDPLQSAMVIRSCIAMQASLLPPPPQLVTATSKRFICSLLLDEHLGSWLDIIGTKDDPNVQRQQLWGASF